MKKIVILGNLIDAGGGRWDNPQRGIIYGTDGIIGCLNGMDFRNNHPKILTYEQDSDSGRPHG